VAGKEITRSQLQRTLVVNALTKPVNVVVAAVVAVAGIALGAVWLVGVALVVYAVLAALTFFDEGEAEKVGKRVYGGAKAPLPKQADLSRLAPPIAQQLGSARAEEARIRAAVEEADLPFAEVTGEVDALVSAMEGIAIRAERVYEYLAAHDPRPVQARLSQLEGAGAESESELAKALREQLAAYEKLSAQLQRFYDEMEHITASLSTVGAQVVSMSAAGGGEAGQRELAGQVRDLRDQVDALSAGMSEAYAAQPDTP
jgi:uncharacterized coiled-coil protein SlyX